jgi:hypothetical protein
MPADYRSLWPPLTLAGRVAGAVCRVRRDWDRTRLVWELAALQRRARRQLARGETHTVAHLIAAGDWKALDNLCDGWATT